MYKKTKQKFKKVAICFFNPMKRVKNQLATPSKIGKTSQRRAQRDPKQNPKHNANKG